MKQKCKHVIIHYETINSRNDQAFRASCSCGRVYTNWHLSKERASIAFEQERQYLIRHGRTSREDLGL